MNRYVKYKPNVRLAECDQEHEKGSIITLQTKYGKENEHYVHNLIYTRGGKFYYSITRADGFNSQVRAEKKAEKYNGYAGNAEARSNTYYQKSNKDKDFLSLGEPIKVWHHSEKRHRKAIDAARNNLGKSVAESEKAQAYRNKAEYRESKANKIDLSMPESIEYYGYLVEKETNNVEKIKATPKDQRAHGYVLTYASKALKEAKEKLETARKLRA